MAQDGAAASSVASGRTIDAVQAVFPQTQGWFRIVSDATFRVEPDGRWSPNFAALHHPRVRAADNAGHTLVPSFAGRFDGPTRIASGEDRDFWIELTPRRAHPVAPRQEGGLVVYHDAFVDTDVLEKSTPTHTDEYLFLRSASAPTEWRYDLTRGPAVGHVRQVGNVLEVVDANGVARIRSSRPFAIDATGARVEGTVRVEGAQLVVRVSTATLRYPVLVDPDWRSTGDMAYGRFYFGANVLPNGRILATGGCSASVCSGDLSLPACRTVVRAAETLDLGTRMWTAAGDDSEGRFFHAAESLTDGAVLLAGGCTNPDCSAVTATARLYEPSTGTFRALPDLAEPRAGMVAARLASGRVLLAGGCTATGCSTRTEIYDPATRGFRPAAPMSVARGRAEWVTLADGRVLVIGGCGNIPCATVLASAEVYDPATDRWTPTGPMGTARAGHHATPLLDGRVFVGGGCSEQRCTSVLRSTELFDISTGRFSSGPDQRMARVGARSVRLPDGRVMVNQGCQARGECDLSNERFDPRAMTFTLMEPAVTTRAFQQTVLHARGRVVVAIGGCQPGTCSWWNETYDISGIATPPEPDAGVTDAGITDAASNDTGVFDATADAPTLDRGSPSPDAQPPADSPSAADLGPAPPAPRSACGCRTVGAAGSLRGWWMVALAALVARRRRRWWKAAATISALGGCRENSDNIDASVDTSTVTDVGRDDGASDASDVVAADVISDAVSDAASDAVSDAASDAVSDAVCPAACGSCQRCVGGACATVGAPYPAARVGIGWNHSFAIDADGRLRAWGANGMGELGLGDREPRGVAERSTTEAAWRTVVAGSRHSCGIKSDGGLWCWGANVHGQLGVGDTTERLVATRVGTASDWVEIQCGGLHTCGIRAGGSLWCWGSNPAGQLGLGMPTGDQSLPRRVGTDEGWRGLAIKARFGCALRGEGELWCWGDNSDGQVGTGDTMDRFAPTAVWADRRWAFVRMGPLHACAITTAGELFCWGANVSGQLGDGSTTARPSPARVGTESDWLAVSGGFSHSCGIRRGGGLWCWGANASGQLGVGDTMGRTVPTRVGVGEYSEVLLGQGHTCALAFGAAVSCWGDNTWGQVGDASTSSRPAVTPVCFGR